jgi:D-sedoheptulose 7-phosphate isomerase
VRQALQSAYPDAGAYLADHLQGGLPAISLVSHTALLTAIVNDIAGDMIFAQQVYGLGLPGDVLIAISTSGQSSNILHALRVARVLGLTTLGFTGRDGGLMPPLCDHLIRVPFDRTAQIQAIYHTVCAIVESTFFPR